MTEHQTDLLSYIAKARKTDPETSWDAARSVKQISDKQALILDLFSMYGPQTDESLIHLVNGRMADSGTRTRRKELVDLGKLRDSGKRGTTPAGRSTIIWSIA